MRQAAANLGGVVGELTCEGGCARQLLTLVSGGVDSKLTCESGCASEAAANLGVSGGVVRKLTCEGGARQLLTLVCLV
jgi:hypothetical protein